MAWLADRMAERLDPVSVMPGAKSLMMVAVNYVRGPAPAAGAGQGSVARYAWGRDYHNVILKRLRKLQKFAERELGLKNYRSIDHGPVLERPYAEQAGLGWAGRHTLLINPELGSWLLLGAVLLDGELDYSAPASDACGTCRICVEACPTDAISLERREVDARRCISYLTIENRGPVPHEFRSGIGNWVFGCDICQEVCPHNVKIPAGSDPAYPEQDVNAILGIESLLVQDTGALKQRFVGSPIARAAGANLRRNALVVAGNQKLDSLAPLYRGLLDDPDPVIRGHAVWTLGEVGCRADIEKLRSDPDPSVRAEVEAVLGSTP